MARLVPPSVLVAGLELEHLVLGHPADPRMMCLHNILSLYLESGTEMFGDVRGGGVLGIDRMGILVWYVSVLELNNSP